SATFPTPPTGFPLGFPYRCGQTRIACGPVRGSLVRVETSGRLYRFAGALERLLAAPDAQAFERACETAHVDRLAWDALGGALRHGARRGPGAPVRADPRRPAAAPVPRRQSPRVPLRAGRRVRPAAVRGAARRRAYRPGCGPLRSDPRARHGAPGDRTGGAEL